MAERIRFDGHVEKGVAMAHAVLTRLRCPNHVIETVEALVANHMKFRDTPHMRESTLKRFIRPAGLSVAPWGLDNYEFVRRKREEAPEEVLRRRLGKERWRWPGRDCPASVDPTHC